MLVIAAIVKVVIIVFLVLWFLSDITQPGRYDNTDD